MLNKVAFRVSAVPRKHGDVTSALYIGRRLMNKPVAMPFKNLATYMTYSKYKFMRCLLIPIFLKYNTTSCTFCYYFY